MLTALLSPTSGPSILRTESTEPIIATRWMAAKVQPARGGYAPTPGVWIVTKRIWAPVSRLDQLHTAPTRLIEPVRRAFPHPAWHKQALCQGADSRTFFGEEGGQRPSLRRSTLGKARVLCNACPVQETCLTWALEKPELFGIWGGTSGRQREALMRRMNEGESVEQLVKECLA